MLDNKKRITIDGGIISELSEKLPNYLIALNELIKNAYDAGAKNVKIKLDSNDYMITIEDNGVGMNDKDIDRLLHLSFSEKKYGSDNEINGLFRKTQGSKGLGFLSVFKFGNNVKWESIKENKITFNINYQEIVSQYNISDYEVNVFEEEAINGENNGTKITIKSNPEKFKPLLEDLTDKVTREKLLNSFVVYDSKTNNILVDPNFLINLEIDSSEYVTNCSLKLDNEVVDSQSIRIKYNSNDQTIRYFFKNVLVHQEHFEYDSSDFALLSDIQTYKFRSGGKGSINELFYKHGNEQLTPLVYVNNNLFNNYDIFDTEIMRSRKTGSVLTQMTGYVLIVSSDSRIDFNSDRTQFIDTSLTRKIIRTINRFNEKIQTSGSKLRNELKGKIFNNTITNSLHKINESDIDKNFKPMDLIQNDLLMKNLISTKVQGNKITFKLFDYIRNVEIIQKPKEEKTVQEEIYIGQNIEEKIENIKEILASNAKIYFDSEEIKEFNWDKPGNLLIISEDDKKIYTIKIKVLEPEQPQIIQLKNTVILGIKYNMGTLFEIFNSYGQKNIRLKPKLYTYDQLDIVYSNNKKTIEFGSIGEKKIKVSLQDKDTNLKTERDIYFRVLKPQNDIEYNITANDYINLLISHGENLPSDITTYIYELNTLDKDDKYEYTFVASVRTLVELCVINILNKLSIEKDISLSKNYQKVIDEMPQLIERFSDPNDKQQLTNIHRKISSPSEINGYISFLNLSTHGSANIITKSEVKIRKSEIQILLEILNNINE